MDVTDLPINSTLRLMLDEVTFVALDEDDNAPQNSGTGTFTLTEKTTNRVVDSGELEYITASDGRYVIEIGPYQIAADPDDPQASEVVRNRQYSLLVNFEQDGEEYTGEIRLKAVYQS